ncbi:MAG: hypothetical protein OEZ06_26075 [Myxococcales bacterium]|nr:hypothetical protein [Myxococcales bacterium]
MKNLIQRSFLVMVWGVLLTALGCGDDSGGNSGDGGPEDNEKLDAAADTGAGSTNTPTTNTPTTPTTPTVPAFMCGDVACPGMADLTLFGLGSFAPCCTEDDNACGYWVPVPADAGGGSICTPRPASDELCPDQDVLGMLQPGCCIEEAGYCGVNGAQVGLGCIDPADYVIFGAFLGLGGSDTPCGLQSDAGSDNDAGQ